MKEVRQSVVGDEAREIGKGQTKEDLVDHSKGMGLYPEFDAFVPRHYLQR